MCRYFSLEEIKNSMLIRYESPRIKAGASLSFLHNTCQVAMIRDRKAPRREALTHVRTPARKGGVEVLY